MQPTHKHNPADFASRIKWLSLALAVQGAVVLIYLAALPTSEKGFSTPRLVMAAALLVAEALLAVWAARQFLRAGREELRFAGLAVWVDQHRFEVLGLSGFATVAGLYLSIRWLFLPPTYETGVTLPRLYPFLLLATLFSAEIFLLALAPSAGKLLPGKAQKGKARRPATASTRRMDRFIALAEPPYRLPRLLAWLTVFFAAASIAGQAVRYAIPSIYRFIDFAVTEFYLDSEMNLPTFFSAALAIFLGLSLAFTAWIVIRDGRPDRVYWIILSLIFLYLPFDEIFSLHEKLTSPMQDRIYAVGLLYWPWFLPFLPFLAILFVTYLRFMLRLPRRTFVLMMVSAALFLGGAIVLEALGAAFADEYGLGNFPYAMITTIEETTELSGLVLFVYTLFDYYARVLRPGLPGRAASPAARKS